MTEEKVLSIFCDESGDFDIKSKHSPYYLFTLVFHDQTIPINTEIRVLEEHINDENFKKMAIHSAPLIRREYPYANLSIDERRSLFNQMFYFTMHCDVKYKTFSFEKKQYENHFYLVGRMGKELYQFIQENLSYFTQFDTIKIYYDNGQAEISQILSTMFPALLNNIEFKKVLPGNYRLFQAADFICTIELLALKREHNNLSKSEQAFFYKPQELKKTYIKGIFKKRL